MASLVCRGFELLKLLDRVDRGCLRLLLRRMRGLSMRLLRWRRGWMRSLRSRTRLRIWWRRLRRLVGRLGDWTSRRDCRFGDDLRTYKDRTPSLVPKLGQTRRREGSECPREGIEAVAEFRTDRCPDISLTAGDGEPLYNELWHRVDWMLSHHVRRWRSAAYDVACLSAESETEG